MNKQNMASLALGIAVIIGILMGALLVEKISGEIKLMSGDLKETSSEIKELKNSINEVNSSLNEVKAILSEKSTAFRRDMQENGRRMLSIDYAGKFERWDSVKPEVEALDRTLEDAANLRPELAQTIQGFRSTYIPKLKDAADKKDIKIFEDAWNEAYNACIDCHKGLSVQP